MYEIFYNENLGTQYRDRTADVENTTKQFEHLVDLAQWLVNNGVGDYLVDDQGDDYKLYTPNITIPNILESINNADIDAGDLIVFSITNTYTGKAWTSVWDPSEFESEDEDDDWDKDEEFEESKKRISSKKQMKEDSRGYIKGINLDKVASHIEEAYDLANGNLPSQNNLVHHRIEYIFNDWVDNDWYDDYGDIIIKPRTLETIKFLKKTLSDKESREYLHFGDLYDQLYDLLFGNSLSEKVGSSDEYSIYVYWENKDQWLPVDEKGSTNGDSLVFSNKKEAVKDPVIEILKSKGKKIKIAPANWNGKK